MPTKSPTSPIRSTSIPDGGRRGFLRKLALGLGGVTVMPRLATGLPEDPSFVLPPMPLPLEDPPYLTNWKSKPRLPVPDSETGGHVPTVREALHRQEPLYFFYTSRSGERKIRKATPVFLFYLQDHGARYMQAWDHFLGESRTFRVDKIGLIPTCDWMLRDFQRSEADCHRILTNARQAVQKEEALHALG